jgi:dipeptidyl-peptidase-4
MGNDGSAASYNARGIAVWKMDNRGSSRRGKEFEAAVFRNMGDLEVRDQVDGVKQIGKLFPEVDLARVGITGGSYGGYMTLRALTEAPETFHVGVSFAPVTDWDGYDTCYTERYMETPQTNPEGYRKSSVLTGVDRIKGKLLLIHGMIDENVHYRHTARLVQALMAANKPFELLAVPEGRHGFRRAADSAFARNKTVQFFEMHLLGKSAGSGASPVAATNAAPVHP